MRHNQKLTTHEFIRRSIIVHGNKYDYSLVEYINNKTKVKIICPTHGIWEQVPTSHYICGCRKCADQVRHNLYAFSTDKFIEMAKLIHKNIYDYSKVNYFNTNLNIDIICKKHGLFSQVPFVHLKGHGCPKCQYENNAVRFTKTTREFINDAIATHGNKYNYSKSVYIDDRTNIEIVCDKHGAFLQSPSSHLQGHGCGKCSTRVSLKETEWLDSIGLPNDIYHRQVALMINGKRMMVDGFDPKNNTIYEFYGDYWHGNIFKYNYYDININNKKTFGQLCEDTLDREKFIKLAGYKMITIWESEFKWLKKKATM
jgi:hypothetical protein